ncbi:TonB-dependent receptor plug domain-containing protein [Algoriphagus mannitolivorans]|uniref:TonB-dependent receptor plug domain-containing protein n=1 Tax=Algoriphagus mannitolivorans TaxID=226504 RepID=UPI00040521EB|nr:TonB-dependent receptor [Algoriphagus mannitolivorans]
MMLVLWMFAGLGWMPLQDTVSLSEIEVSAPSWEHFASGQKVISFEKRELNDYSARSLADLLQEKSPVFVRQYGSGMLASPSFRGTSAGHTAIFWNGIPLNSPSLGQSDLSLMPIQAIDQVQLQFGSSGALMGNEAIGGSVHLKTNPSFEKGLKANFSQTAGSYGLFHSGTSVHFSSQKLSIQSRFYRQFSANKFRYRDLSLPGTPEKFQENAQVEQMGWVQNLSWVIGEKDLIKASFWWNQADRQIQPVMGSRTRDQQEDQSFRAVWDYTHFWNNSSANLKLGWVQDELNFNGIDNQTSQFFLIPEWNFDFWDNWEFKVGGRATFAKGELSTYSAKDNRLETYQSALWRPKEVLSLSLNLRQLAFEDLWKPFLPSLGVDWIFWKKEKEQWMLKSSMAKGFKVPTLNDRFWEPGGNPDLLPEESLSGELGLHWTKRGFFNLEQSLTYFRMKVDNWIIWMPMGAVWSPQNIRKVTNQGLEYEGKLDWSSGPLDWQVQLGYSLTQALDLTTDSNRPQQLPYTPRHQTNTALKAELGSIAWDFSGTWVGQRSIGTGDSRKMDPFHIWNTGISCSALKWGKVQFPIRFQILNLFNADYQVLYLRAMPGRTYQFNLSIHL